MASRAFSSTESTLISFSAGNDVSWWALCGQYAQSSGHAPVFTESSVQSCTAPDSWC